MNWSSAIWAVASCMATRSGSQVDVGLAALELAGRRVVEVVDQDLLGQRERATEALSAQRDPFVEGGVDLR